PGTPPAATQAPGASPRPARQVNMKCRTQAQQKGLRGEALRDSMQVCVLETRLACLKKAIAQKIVGPARRDFVGNCDG
ncbi:MAG: hypothetical protein WA792_04785, partial [Pseudolabrys sp.]